MLKSVSAFFGDYAQLNDEAKRLRMLSYTKKGVKVLYGIFRFLIILGLSFIILYPLLYILAVSFRDSKEVMDPTVVWIPKSFTLLNYELAWGLLDYSKSMPRTSLMVVLCTFLQCFTCALTGYGFARFKFKGKTFFLVAALLSLLMPVQCTNLPLFLNYAIFTNQTGIPILDTPLPMTLQALLGVGIRSGLFIYLFYQFYRNLPLELEDAAYVDGCKPIRTFFSVVVPNSGPVILLTLLLSMTWYWNDFMTSSMFYSQLKPLSLLLDSLQDIKGMVKPDGVNRYSIIETHAYPKSAALLFLAPVLTIYLILQKKFTKSFVLSGIVG